MAEARNIAVVAATLGTRGRFEPGIVAEALHKVGCVSQRDAAMDERAVHHAGIRAPP